jgi:hypothetical protein
MIYHIPIQPDHIRVLKSPNFDGIRTAYAYVPLIDFPSDIALSPDPRVPKPNAVVRRIKDSLRSEDGLFHILNRGIAISAFRADYDNQKGILTLDIPDEEYYGILDGGHSNFSVDEVRAALMRHGQDSNQFVKIEILTGVEEHLGKIASARNFSKAVKEISLANYNKELNWFKESLGPVAARLRWSENDDQEFDATEYIQVVAGFDLERYTAVTHPLESYKNAGKCLDSITEPSETLKALKPIIGDVVRLYDTMRKEWWDKYRQPDEEGRFGRPGRRKEVQERKRGRGRLLQFPSLGADPIASTDSLYHVEKGLVIPLVTAFRSLIEVKDGQARWKTDPFAFWSLNGSSLVRKVMDASDQRNQNPQLVGRDPTVYEALYESVELMYLRQSRA